MASRVEIIQFKSQKDINKDRQLKLERRKLDIRRQVDEIKNSQNQR